MSFCLAFNNSFKPLKAALFTTKCHFVIEIQKEISGFKLFVLLHSNPKAHRESCLLSLRTHYEF